MVFFDLQGGAPFVNVFDDRLRRPHLVGSDVETTWEMNLPT